MPIFIGAEGLTISGKRIVRKEYSGETNYIGTEGDKISQVKGQNNLFLIKVFCLF